LTILSDCSSDFDRAHALVDNLVDEATGGNASQEDFLLLREFFTKHGDYGKLLPEWYPSKRSTNQFWQFIKHQFPTYAERRSFLWNEFEPLLSHIESASSVPATDDIEAQLANLNSEAVSRVWRLILYRLPEDLEGAITLARTLIESVCKHILDDRIVEYDSTADLPVLYRAVASELNLAPEQHQEQIFKQILGGCSGVVSGLGAIRNKLGDAHGDGRLKIRPSKRHANFAVNVGASMALFLLETHEAAKP